MIISFLSWAVVMAAFFQPTNTRRLAAACFVIPLAILELNYEAFTGEMYYVVCAATATLITFLLYYVTPVIIFSLRLQKICITSIVLNAFGWVIYMLRLQPDIYNYAFMLLYFVTLVTMLNGGAQNVVGNYRADRRSLDVRSIFSALHNSAFKNPKALP